MCATSYRRVTQSHRPPEKPIVSARYLANGHQPAKPSSPELGLAAVNILRMSMQGLLFGSPHQRLDPNARFGSVDFRVASALFFAASLLRHGALGGARMQSVLLACALVYGVLLLVSFGDRIAEFMLCLSISIGADLAVSGLILLGAIDPNTTAVREWPLVWELAAIFIALCRLRHARLQHLGPNATGVSRVLRSPATPYLPIARRRAPVLVGAGSTASVAAWMKVARAAHPVHRALRRTGHGMGDAGAGRGAERRSSPAAPAPTLPRLRVLRPSALRAARWQPGHGRSRLA